MWFGRFWPIVAVLAIAGSLAAKKRMPVTAGTMPTHGPTFVILLIGTVLLVGALTYVPALALGPMVEHLMLWGAEMAEYPKPGRWHRGGDGSCATTHAAAQAFHVRSRAAVARRSSTAFRKLDPRVQWRNPVMFVVYIGSILTTALWFQALGGQARRPPGSSSNVAIWLWFTVLFANFAEALAEGRSKAQAAALRGLKQTV